MCGKGTNTVAQNTSQTSTPTAQASDLYSQILGQAQGVAATPYRPYPGELVAPVNAQQMAGIANINSYQPSFAGAQQMAYNAAQPISQQQIQRYMSPYTQDVVNATQAQFNNTNAQQNQQVLGNAAAQGALGGNRVGIAQAELANQQNLAQAPVIAGLENQGYLTGLNTALTEQQAMASGAYGVAGIGQAGVSAANAQMGAGSLLQQTQQQQDIANYQQFMLKMGYPFQTTQWLGGLGTGVGSQMGGTTAGTGTTTGPPPNYLAQGISGAMGGVGLLGATGAFGSSGWGAAALAPFFQRGGRVGIANHNEPEPFPERHETLLAQQQQLINGHRPVQMFPHGTAELPLPKGMARTEAASGVFHYHPQKITKERIHHAARGGRENEILGLGPYSKHDIAHRYHQGEHPVAVVERNPAGHEVRAALGTHLTAHEQFHHMDRSKSPGHTVRFEHIHDVLRHRQANGVVNRQSGGSVTPYSGVASWIPSAPLAPGQWAPNAMNPPPTPGQFAQMVADPSNPLTNPATNPFNTQNMKGITGLAKTFQDLQKADSATPAQDAAQDAAQDLEAGEWRGGAIGIAHRASGGKVGVMSLDEMWDEFNKLTKPPSPPSRTPDGVAGYGAGGAPDLPDDSTGVAYPDSETSPQGYGGGPDQAGIVPAAYHPNNEIPVGNTPVGFRPSRDDTVRGGPRLPRGSFADQPQTVATAEPSEPPPPAPSPPVGVVPANVPLPTPRPQLASLETGTSADTGVSGAEGNPLLARAAAATRQQETGGVKDPYRNITTTLNRYGKPQHALGAYGIMDFNLPKWSKEALGYEVTPEKFLKNDKIQDAIYNYKMGGYLNRFGVEGAGRAWLGGEGSLNAPLAKDALGTTVGGYGKHFASLVGSGTSVAGTPTKTTDTQTAVAQNAPASNQGVLGQMKDRLSKTDFGSENPLWMSLMAAGAAGLSSRSPFLGNALGEALGAGAQTYYGQKLNAQQQELAAKKLSQQLDIHHADLAQKALTLSESIREHKAGEAQKTSEEKQKQEFHEVPVGYHRTDKGGLEPIPGGPADPTTVGALSEAKMQGGLLNDAAINLAVDRLKAGDKSALQNLGRGAQTSANLARIQNRLAERASTEQWTGADLAAANANFGAQSAAARNAAVRESQIQTSIEEAKNTFPLALEASQKVPRSEFVPWNKLVQKAQEATSSPELKALHVALRGVITAYAQAMSRTGTTSVHAQQAAEELLNTADSPEALEAAIHQMEREMDAAVIAPETVRKGILSRISGKGTEAPATMKEAEAARKGTATPPSQTPQPTGQAIPPVPKGLEGAQYSASRKQWRKDGKIYNLDGTPVVPMSQ